MKKAYSFCEKLFLCLIPFIGLKIYAIGLGASLTVRAGASGSVYRVEQLVSGSLIVTNYSGSSIQITNIVPYAFVNGAVQGASVISWAKPQFDLHAVNGVVVSPWSTVGFGGGVSGNPSIGASAIWFQYPAVFHTPSIWPAYSGNSLIPVGGQTYTMGASIYGSDGIVKSADVRLEIDPIPLPSSETSGTIGWY